MNKALAEVCALDNHSFSKIPDAKDDNDCPWWECMKCPELRTRRGASIPLVLSASSPNLPE